MLMQFVSVVHASEHQFHDEQSYCVVLKSVESNKSLTPDVAVRYIVAAIALSHSSLPEMEILSANVILFHSRAPPHLTV